jgi:hypothetical protein
VQAGNKIKENINIGRLPLPAPGDEEERRPVELIRMLPDGEAGELLWWQAGQAVIKAPIGLDGGAFAELLGQLVRR